MRRSRGRVRPRQYCLHGLQPATRVFYRYCVFRIPISRWGIWHAKRIPTYGKIEGMTTLLEEVVADLFMLSEDEQDRAARALQAFLGGPEELVM